MTRRRGPVYTMRGGELVPIPVTINGKPVHKTPSLDCPKCGKPFYVRSGGRFNHIRACKGQP